MFFPILHIPGLGDGMTIALDAVLHVFISHGVAIGLVTMIVLFQTLAWRGRGEFWAQFGHRLLVPVVVVITAVGAVTGVGIWFITGALAPEGIGSLIHLFFWPWFIEWMAFTGEVIFLLVYYYLWRKLAAERPGLLAFMGWGYVVMAVSSAFLITGILGFMLTPDGWPWGKLFTEAYFNPTFIPQFFLRVSGGVAMGSLLALAWAAWRFKGTREERGRVLRVCGIVLLSAVVTAGLSASVYFSRVPQTYLTHWRFAVATSALSQDTALLPVINAAAALFILILALAALFRRQGWSRALCFPALVLSLGLMMEFERVREFVRGPYLLPGYMYANQIVLAEHEALSARDAPLLPRIRWLNRYKDMSPDESAGRALFDVNCGVCHTVGGINDIRARLAGRTQDGVNVIIGLTEELAPFMTPFTGSDRERLQLADYLYTLTNPGPRMDRTIPPPAPQTASPTNKDRQS